MLAAAFVPVYLLLEFAQEQWARWDWNFLISLAIAIYSALYVAGVLRALTGSRQAKAASTFAGMLCLAILATYSFEFGASFWYEYEDS